MNVIAATGNMGKIREFARIFAPFGIEVTPQKDVVKDLSVEETGDSFSENAFLKANTVHQITGKSAVADDSGLCIDALDGAPGIYSARYCGEDTSYTVKMDSLLKELQAVPENKRTARFVSHICYIDENGVRIDAEGTCEGIIGLEPRGNKGFGFDPIFYVNSKSFAELDNSEKDAYSHRGKALRLLAKKLEEHQIGEKNMLTSKQRAKLRGLANPIETILQVGKGGINDALIKQVNDALTARELIKMRVLDNSPEPLRDIAQQLAESTNSEVVQTIGTRFVLYRRNNKKPIIELD